MEQRKLNNSNNNIFTSAFTGVILLIISIAVSIFATKVGHAKDVPYIILSVTTGITAITLLSYAVKKDNERQQLDTDFQ
ncbi:hypothetical protein CJD36_015025 [Flavipsychrobacter stenotrophus]|uniref:YiaAB two helix domain-containing protein n=1 Tax=Flavipsychrobacter stenotrophus TaxID=2077091 RepID=A0A2S7SSV7_9BACT|nr:hypothetical protein [Flavipsychrobacter stenotrophus]PQJ10009.1 hypothetical protein CJD36_015025 [Flavipsychrobacter stenotrophus]